MATKSSAFRLIIDKVTAKDRTVHIEDIYRGVSIELPLDEEDRKSTTLRGKATGEPAWKRNVRNVLQGMKNKGLLVNVEKNYWKKSNPNQQQIIPTELAWEVTLEAGMEKLSTNEIFHSPQKQHQYRITKVHESKIEIHRIDGNKPDFINSFEVERAIRIINAADGIVGRRTLNHTVAKETAIVFLHPALRWSDDFSSILAIEAKAIIGDTKRIKPTKKQIIEAMDDDPTGYQETARKIRKGQFKFRENLLKVYNQKCCITGMGPENVLQAAHIETHSAKGNNQSVNGLLLRSDLHDLFDDNLIAIHPDTLAIFIHDKLRNTYYAQFHGKLLLARNDGKRPSHADLLVRWKAFNLQKDNIVVSSRTIT